MPTQQQIGEEKDVTKQGDKFENRPIVSKRVYACIAQNLKVLR